MVSPTVSVVMPLYNSSTFMEESVRSVLQQTFSDLELILVDDCSSDASLDQARAYALNDPRIRVIAQAENGGGGAARNAGITLARGRYIAFLDSDDCWEREKLAIQLAQMEEKKAAFSYTDYAIIMESGQTARVTSTPAKLGYHDLLKDNVIGCSTVIYDSCILGKRYFPLIRKRQDFGLWLSILRDIDCAHRCGTVSTRYRVRSGSVSSNKCKAAAFTWRLYRELEKLPFPHAVYYFSHYVLSGVRKRL